VPEAQHHPHTLMLPTKASHALNAIDEQLLLKC